MPAGLLVTVPTPVVVTVSVAVAGGASWFAATSTWMRGVTRPLRPSVIDFPVLLSAASACVTVADGTRCLSSAQAPVTCGVDIDVPLREAKPLVGLGTDDVIDTPGASRLRNDAELEKLAITSLLEVAPT